MSRATPRKGEEEGRGQVEEGRVEAASSRFSIAGTSILPFLPLPSPDSKKRLEAASTLAYPGSFDLIEGRVRWPCLNDPV